MSIQLKRSFKSNLNTNHILKQGQLGIEMPSSTNYRSNPFKMKIGDGSSAWSSLPYFGDTSFVTTDSSSGYRLFQIRHNDPYSLGFSRGMSVLDSSVEVENSFYNSTLKSNCIDHSFRSSGWAGSFLGLTIYFDTTISLPRTYTVVFCSGGYNTDLSDTYQFKYTMSDINANSIRFSLLATGAVNENRSKYCVLKSDGSWFKNTDMILILSNGTFKCAIQETYL